MVRQLVVALAVGLVGHADPNGLEMVEHVELGDGQFRERVDPGRVPEHHGVQPSRTATPTRVGAVLVAHVHEVVADLVEQFGGERSGTHAGDVGLDDANDPVDVARADTRARARAAGHRIRRGHKWVGAVVDVQEGGLGALHEDAATTVQLVVDQAHGVANVGSQPGGAPAQVLLGHLVGVDGQPVEDPGQHLVGVLQGGSQLLAEDLLVEKVLDPDTDPHGPVGVRRTDAPLGSTQLVLAQVTLMESIEFLVVREDQVGVSAEAEIGRRDPAGLEHVHLGDEDAGINHHAITDDRGDVGIEDTTGNKLEGEGLTVDHQRVASVVATLVADDHRHLASNEVGELALALVAPLCPYDDGRGHGTSPGSGPLRAEPTVLASPRSRRFGHRSGPFRGSILRVHRAGSKISPAPCG